jgi:hypothetical protein
VIAPMAAPMKQTFLTSRFCSDDSCWLPCLIGWTARRHKRSGERRIPRGQSCAFNLTLHIYFRKRSGERRIPRGQSCAFNLTLHIYFRIQEPRFGVEFVNVWE